jgi:hypothetical protein
LLFHSDLIPKCQPFIPFIHVYYIYISFTIKFDLFTSAIILVLLSAALFLRVPDVPWQFRWSRRPGWSDNHLHSPILFASGSRQHWRWL